MSKIFSFNEAGFGSYRDNISGTLGINTNGQFKKTEKQYSWRSNTDGDKIVYSELNLGTIHSILFEGKIEDAFDKNILGHSGLFSQFRPLSSSVFRYSSKIVTDKVEFNTSFVFNKFYSLLIVREDLSVKFYQDNILINTLTLLNNTDFMFDSIGKTYSDAVTFYGKTSKIILWDNVITTQERNNLYKDFLRNKGTGSSIHENGFPIKADDLSNVNGLVAAYTFDKGYTGDVSGNVRHLTNSGAISIKNGISCDGVANKLTRANLPNTGKSFSINTRIKPEYNSGNKTIYSHGSILVGGGGTKLYFNSATNLAIIIADDVSRVLDLTNTVSIDGKDTSVSLIGTLGSNAYLYINGILTKTIDLSTLTGNFITGDFILANDASADYLKVDYYDAQYYNREITLQEIQNYHNQFVKPVTLENFSSEAVFLVPREWIKESGIFLIYEDITGDKYLQCDSNGVAKFLYKDTLLGTASIDYYNGSVWVTVTDTLENLISTYSWLSHDGQYLIFTFTNGDRIDNIIIKNGILS